MSILATIGCPRKKLCFKLHSPVSQKSSSVFPSKETTWFLWITHVCWTLTRLSSLMARQSWISGRVKKCSLKQFFLWTPCKSFPTLAPPYLAKSSSKFLNHMVDEKKILQDSTWQNLWKTVVMSSSNLCVSQTLQRYTYSKVLRLVFSSYPPPTYHGRDHISNKTIFVFL